MRKTPLIVPIAAALMALSACDNSERPDFYNGTGLLDVTINVEAPEGFDLALPDPQEFSLTMTGADNASYSHHWAKFSDFPQSTAYLAGNYIFSATHGDTDAEGFDKPYFSVDEEMRLTEGITNTLTLTARLTNVPVTVEATDAFAEAHAGWKATVHAEGGDYIPFDRFETREAFLHARPLTVAVGLGPDGESIFRIARNIPTVEGCMTRLVLDTDGTDAVLKFNGTEAGRIDASPAAIAAPGPQVTLTGADPATPLTLLERTRPETPVVFEIESQSIPAEILLTINSPALQAVGAPRQIDLIDPDSDGSLFLETAGLALKAEGDGGILFDITPLFSKIQYLADVNATSQFSLTVTDANGRQSAPGTFTVNTRPFDIEVISASPAVIGINTVDLIVAAPATKPLENELNVFADTGDGERHRVEIKALAELPDGTFRVTLTIPPGTGPVKILAFYGSELKSELTVERVSPAYTIESDPFSTVARFRVVCADNPGLEGVITRSLVMTCGDKQLIILSRDEDAGVLIVSGLEAATRYDVEATLQPGVADATRRVTFVTEGARALPNGDFDDIKKGIDYDAMECGGRYSQTFAEIFNCQNHRSFHHFVPTGWANTNAKTFNKGSKNHNTWYMQPSVYTIEDVVNGDYAVELVSTAFDPDGKPIPDYLQESLPYVRYSRNVPEIAWRAAGKIFLGSYSFDPSKPEEAYTEGVAFDSRPASLDGYYSYIPTPADPSDRGLVTVEVTGIVDGQETTIAGGSARLDPNNGFTTFTIPLTYNRFGVKATRIKVMAASSFHAGPLHSETVNVPVLANPREGCALGSRLRLDNLSFAY